MDAPKYPGTEMDVLEKYPPGRRINHPDFADVAKTTFAKGTISEFRRPDVEDPDNPIRVESMVKVMVEGEESGFIPLFYHPKAKYWEDLPWDDESEPILATAYNEEEGYFEKAWMSFRGDDEVAVMLREDVPVAVVGFADGKPRIGEDIILVEFPSVSGGCPPEYEDHFFYLQCSIQDIYQWDEPDGLDLDIHRKGPESEGGEDDGLELGLTEEYTFSWYGGLYYEPPKAWAPNITGGNRDYCAAYGTGQYSATRYVFKSEQYYHEFVVPVGPILYIFQVLWSTNYYYTGIPVPISEEEYDAATIEYYDEHPIWSSQYVRLVSMHDGGKSYESCTTTIDKMVCRAAVYSQELFDAIEGEPGITTEEAFQTRFLFDKPWGTAYEDTFLQTDFPMSGILAAVCDYGLKPQWDEAIFKVRPHKEEAPNG